MRLGRAVDLWLGELARAGRTPATRFSYERYLFKLVDHVERSRPDAEVREVTVNDCRAFLDKWIERSPSTIASIHSALSGLFSWLYLEGEIDENPMLRIKRPRRLRPEDVAVVTVTRAEVDKMLAGAQGGRSSSASPCSRTRVSGATPRAGCAGTTSTWSKG